MSTNNASNAPEIEREVSKPSTPLVFDSTITVITEETTIEQAAIWRAELEAAYNSFFADPEPLWTYHDVHEVDRDAMIELDEIISGKPNWNLIAAFRASDWRQSLGKQQIVQNISRALSSQALSTVDGYIIPSGKFAGFKLVSQSVFGMNTELVNVYSRNEQLRCIGYVNDAEVGQFIEGNGKKMVAEGGWLHKWSNELIDLFELRGNAVWQANEAANGQALDGEYLPKPDLLSRAKQLLADIDASESVPSAEKLAQELNALSHRLDQFLANSEHSPSYVPQQMRNLAKTICSSII